MTERTRRKTLWGNVLVVLGVGFGLAWVMARKDNGG